MGLLYSADGHRVQHASNSIYNFGATGTFMMWIYATSDTLRQSIISRDGTTAYYAMAWRADLAGDNFEWTRQRSTAQVAAISGAANFAAYGLNKWLFIAGVFNTGGANADQKIYMGDRNTSAAEPSSYSSQTVGSGTVSTTYGTNDLYIGNSRINTAREFNGRIAFCHLLNTALTQKQIIAQQWKPQIRAGETVLFAHYGFPGTSCPDYSGNKINGTVTGAVNAPHVPFSPLFGSAAARPSFAAPVASSDVFFEGLHRIETGMKAQTAAGLGGVIIE